MRVLLTGAAGLTGGAVSRALLTRGHETVGLVRRPESLAMLPRDVRGIVGDCRDALALRDALRGCEALVHGAGITLGADVAATPGLGDLASVVVVSSAGVYSRHRASAAAYRSGEDALRAAAPRATVIRPTMIYGSPRDRNIHHVIAFARRFGFVPLFADGRARVQPIHYEDLGNAIAALVGSEPAATVDAGGERALTVRALAEEIFRVLGRPPRVIRVPAAPALAAARLMDTIRHTRFAERIERLSEDRGVDNARLLLLTGVSLRPFADGCAAEAREMLG